MEMPSRIEIRRWLLELSRDDILILLERIKAEHGESNCQDVKDFLNLERKTGKTNSPAEASLASIEMPQTLAEIESLKKLHKGLAA